MGFLVIPVSTVEARAGPRYERQHREPRAPGSAKTSRT